MHRVPYAFVITLLSILCSGCGDDDGSASTSAATGPSGQVIVSERTWTDTTRTTPSNGPFPASPARTLRVLIWQTEAGPPAPLVLLAHGWGGLPEKFDAFARALAAAGFVVAAPAFPLTNENAPGGHERGLRDAVSQPADLSFLVTQMLLAATVPGDPLTNRIAASQLAVLGHSLGGDTTIALTRKDCCRDSRFAAVILVAAPKFFADNAFPGSISATGPPTMILQGTADMTVPYDTAPTLFALFDPPKFLVGITGAGHSDALESQLEPAIRARQVAERATIAFLNAQFRGAASALDATFSELAVEGHIVEVDE